MLWLPPLFVFLPRGPVPVHILHGHQLCSSLPSFFPFIDGNTNASQVGQSFNSRLSFLTLPNRKSSASLLRIDEKQPAVPLFCRRTNARLGMVPSACCSWSSRSVRGAPLPRHVTALHHRSSTRVIAHRQRASSQHERRKQNPRAPSPARARAAVVSAAAASSPIALQRAYDVCAYDAWCAERGIDAPALYIGYVAGGAPDEGETYRGCIASSPVASGRVTVFSLLESHPSLYAPSVTAELLLSFSCTRALVRVHHIDERRVMSLTSQET